MKVMIIFLLILIAICLILWIGSMINPAIFVVGLLCISMDISLTGAILSDK